MSFWSSPVRTPTARKRHTCQLCLQDIEAGTTYETWRCVLDDSMSTVKVHQSCWLLLKEYSDPSEGYYEVSDDALYEAFRGSEPTRDDCTQVAGEDGARVWSLFNDAEEDDVEEDAPRGTPRAGEARGHQGALEDMEGQGRNPGG